MTKKVWFGACMSWEPLDRLSSFEWVTSAFSKSFPTGAQWKRLDKEKMPEKPSKSRYFWYFWSKMANFAQSPWGDHWSDFDEQGGESLAFWRTFDCHIAQHARMDKSDPKMGSKVVTLLAKSGRCDKKYPTWTLLISKTIVPIGFI